MKFKRLSMLFVLMLALNTFFSSFAFADGTDKKSLVALGDSITHGWNLGDDHTDAQPINEQAFPYLIQNTKYTVTKNISGGGWTTSDLMDQISNPVNPNNAANIAAIQKADLITLDIGNNDLLKVPEVQQILAQLKANPPVLPTQEQIAAATAALTDVIKNHLPQNLGAIISFIKSQNPNAPIILYNQYNPFGVNAGPLHDLGQTVIPAANQVIASVSGALGCFTADAYSAFEGHQSEYILPGDVHPTILGHQVLAGLANDILTTLGFDITLTPLTTEPTTGPVTINVSTDAKEVVQMRWLEGEKTVADFGGGAGADITDNKFEVSKNGKYTVYVMDRNEHENVQVIDISNITPPAPKDFTIDLTPSTTDPTTDPVTITVSTTAEKVVEMKWLEGEKTVTDFANVGNGITDNEFDVTANGKYTVYVKDGNGLEKVQVIDISNITSDDSGNGGNGNPGDNGNDNGNGNGNGNDNGSVNGNPPPTDTHTPQVDTGNSLPETATPIYNYLAIGLVFILAGLVSMKIQQYRRRRENM